MKSVEMDEDFILEGHLRAMRTTSLSLQRSGCAKDKQRQEDRMASCMKSQLE